MSEHDARCEREYHKGVLIIDCLCRTRSAMADAWDEGYSAATQLVDFDGMRVWAHTVTPSGYEGNPYRDTPPEECSGNVT